MEHGSGTCFLLDVEYTSIVMCTVLVIVGNNLSCRTHENKTPCKQSPRVTVRYIRYLLGFAVNVMNRAIKHE